MAFCTNCGSPMEGSFCTQCGGRAGDAPAAGISSHAAPPPATLTGISLLTNGSITFSGLGIQNVQYSIQAATNLTPPTFWTPLGNETAGANGLFQFIDPHSPQFPIRFYRAVSL